MKRVLLAGAALAALSSASFAADMPAYPAEPAFVEPVDVWSGFYAGIQAGYAFGNVDYAELGGTIAIAPDPGDFDIDGWNAGIFYGRNWQSGNLVFGLDGSISGADIEETYVSGADSIGVTIEAFTTSRLRVGYAFDNFLLYAAGGVSLARAEIDFNDSGSLDSDEETLFGFAVGAGVEAMISENWSARLEYVYLDYEDETVTADANPGLAQYTIDLDAHVVRGGFAYHF